MPYSITKELAEKFCNFAIDADITFSNDYSGRGMFGQKCIAFNSRLTEFIGELLSYIYYDTDEKNRYLLPEVFDMLKDTHEDSLGLGGITYFPSYTCDDEYMADYWEEIAEDEE